MYLTKIKVEGGWMGVWVEPGYLLKEAYSYEAITIEKIEQDIAELHKQLAVSDKILNQLVEKGLN